MWIFRLPRVHFMPIFWYFIGIKWTMIFAPNTQPDRFALSKAAGRGRIRRIAAGLYTDDLTTPLEALVAEKLPALIAARYPDAYLSHSTAALLRPFNGSAYISTSGSTTRPVKLPGVTVHRRRLPPFPEVTSIDLEEMVARSLSSEPNPLKARISSPLQTVFELLTPSQGQPEKSLPQEKISGLIDALSESDRLRASAFAERNHLQKELTRFDAILEDLRKTRGIQIIPPQALSVFFYKWRIGQLETLPNREFRFTYDENWTIPVTGLPMRDMGPSYEGPGLPAFFDNMLPEGWAEARLQAAYKIARSDTFALLRTTQKYLSNITLRQNNFDESRLSLDFLSTRLSDIHLSNDPLPVLDDIDADPDSRELWLELRRRGATRLSGIQPKLPIHLDLTDNTVRLKLGEASNTSTHILKLSSPEYPQLIENEWTTMELAHRVGLIVAAVRRVSFSVRSNLKSPGLLIERFDIPTSVESPRRILLLEEAASLLGITRHDKYDVSMERIASALLMAGLVRSDIEVFFDHVVFSWITGNGDLHAKNIAVLRSIEPGSLGDQPRLVETRYSPLYDLVNTELVIPGDLFALPVNGKQNNLRANDFAVLARLWGGTKAESRDRVHNLASRITAELPRALSDSALSDEFRERYQHMVEKRTSVL
jgi:serine/threonine-protein kinase HipA